ncbi:hypothetical protein [Natronomonas salsuginis]|uniref:hypothetical protein n=1 Tax=Natronomonas salsuginis TaxID=2217661 RepID=UPI001C9E6578|nr:hypothetical protein [Natronomonas salsuginis]
MIDTKRFLDRLSSDRGADFEFGADLTNVEIREVARSLKAQGLCGRRIAEQRLGP